MHGAPALLVAHEAPPGRRRRGGANRTLALAEAAYAPRTMSKVVEAKRMPGPPGSLNALAAPFDLDTAPRACGPFAIAGHHKTAETAPGVLPVDADVRPHPHIGLTAISFVLEGAVTHRDSLGHRVELRAGDVGITVSGRGVVHSERFERRRLLGGGLDMFQLLLALPDGHEEVEPSFIHRAASELPTTSEGGATVRFLLPAPPSAPTGIPVKTPILLAEVRLDADGRWSPPASPERALYVIDGEIEVGTSRASAGQVVILDADDPPLRAIGKAHLLAFGGEPVGPRFMWWNYLHSSLERIEAAKAEWRAGKVRLPDGDTESFTPCPPDDGRPLRRINQPRT